MALGGVVEPPGRPGAPGVLFIQEVHLAARRSLGALYLLVQCRRPSSLQASLEPQASLESLGVLATAISVVWGARLGGAPYLKVLTLGRLAVDGPSPWGGVSSWFALPLMRFPFVCYSLQVG